MAKLALRRRLIVVVMAARKGLGFKSLTAHQYP
jgi:hypothetical protein